jgi:myo-inositol-1(or 4)-monophosphatase
METARKLVRPASPLGEEEISEIERIAIQLARLAGTEVQAALGGLLKIRYKDAPDTTTWRDPVSEVDQRVEKLIRDRLAERFPDHDILGEEMDTRPARDHDVVWAIDPIDGTTNFVNGFPLFAASLGVLYRGRPIVGALWCSTSHALRPGVYHACAGAPLHFDEEPIEPKPNPAVRRRLAGVPQIAKEANFPWEGRKTGSAAIECAFVAAGLLRVASFERPNVWDVAGGVALVQAAGCAIQVRGASGWSPFERFEPMSAAEGSAPDLRLWHQSMILGEPEDVKLLLGMQTA